MSSSIQAALGSWSIDPILALGLIATGGIYFRGWRVLNRVTPARFPTWRLVAFCSGLTAFWVATASPLDAFSGLLLSAHMVQHLLLMFVAPPLILLGAPFLPMLRGLPRAFAHDGLGPFLSWPALHRCGRALTHPFICWLAMATSLCAWHIPAAYDLALRSPGWHKVEHACFFGASLLFWWPVIRPFPSRPHWPLWAMPLYLLAGDMVNSALCATLVFSEHPIYPTYEAAPRLLGTTALSDQIAAGVIMWLPGSLVLLVPAIALMIQYLSPGSALVRPLEKHSASQMSRARALPKPVPSLRPFDLLTVPFLGRFLRAKAGRRVMQAVMLIAALAVIVDGLFGKQVSASNMAGVLPWIYWRGLTVIVLLIAGNFFCMACPFMLPRELGRLLGLNTKSWPRALRSKWLAIAVLGLFFWAYEAFGFWDWPAATAWLVIGYFATAFLVDAFFRGASFCKYVCPIGQFQFVSSMLSPLEVKIRTPDACVTCKTHDCLRGNENARGCEMDLHLPRKVGNLDCTFCLDCVRACPHDNIGLLGVTPGADLARDPLRSSVGRLSARLDLASLAVVLVFAAFAGAAAMAAPVMAWRDELVARFSLSSSLPVTTLFFVVALLLVPFAAIGAAALVSRSASGTSRPSRELLCRFSFALVPLGTSMWVAHFGFHLLAGYGAVWPLLQQAAGATGVHFLGEPAWSASRLGLSGDSLRILQTLLLDAGLLLTLYIAWRIARDLVPDFRTALALASSWAVVAIFLYATGIWIFLQPMQMRGMASSFLSQ